MADTTTERQRAGAELTGRRVVVIGGTSGIGLATAQRAAQLGAEVVVASRTSRSVADALDRLPGTATGHVLDVRHPEGVAELFETVGPHDHLAFTAGDPLSFAPLGQSDLTAMQSFLDVRLWGAVAAVRAALPFVRRSITLSGGAGLLRPGPGFTTAAIALGAIDAFTRAGASELAPIRVNAVFPGVVRSPLWRSLSEAEQERFFAEAAETIPVGRVGTTEDIARTFTHLMTSEYTTGQVLIVDGGASIGAR